MKQTSPRQVATSDKSGLQAPSVDIAQRRRQQAGQIPGIVHQVLHSPGSPLDPITRGALVPRLRRDFAHVPLHGTPWPVAPLRVAERDHPLEIEADRVSHRPADDLVPAPPGGALGQVRIHADRHAARAARAVNARAFTVGDHIVFGEGEYRPTTEDGQRLLTHELAHVAQTGLRRSSPTTLFRQASGTAPVADDADLDPDPATSKKPKGSRGEDKASTSPPDAAATDQGAPPPNAPTIPDAPAAATGPMPTAAKDVPAVKGDAAGKDEEKPAEPKPITELPTGLLALIDVELAEHQRWGAAAALVGAAGSEQRAEFIAQSAAGGAEGGLKQGLVQGAKFGVGTKLAEKAVEKGAAMLAVRVGAQAAKFTPLPAVGAVIGGVMSAYDLASRDWKATGEKFGKFGKGASIYDMLANSIEAYSTYLELATAILNIIAGVIGVISIAMWAITVATVGVASPLALTLSTIAAAIGIASLIIDGINALVIKKLVMMFRVLHAFTDESDPRDVVVQGNAIGEAAGAATGFVGGFAGGMGAGAATEKGIHIATPKKPPPVPGHPSPPAATGDGPTVKAEPVEGATTASDTTTTQTKAPEVTAPETTAAPDVKAAEVKGSDVKAADTTTPETKAPETKAPETKAPETKQSEITVKAEPVEATPPGPADAPATVTPPAPDVAAQQAAPPAAAPGGPGGPTKTNGKAGGGGGGGRKGGRNKLTKKEMQEMRAKLERGESLTEREIKDLAEQHGTTVEQMKSQVTAAEKAVAVEQLRDQIKGNRLVDAEIENVPGPKPKAMRKGERAPGGPSAAQAKEPWAREARAAKKGRESSARREARERHGRAVQEALKDPSKHTPLTMETLKNLEAMGLEHVEAVRETGQLPSDMDFSHLMGVKDFPEFAHRGEEVGIGAEHKEHIGEHHAGDTTASLETLSPRDIVPPERAGMQLGFDPEQGKIQSPNPGVLKTSPQRAQWHERRAVAARRRAAAARERADAQLAKADAARKAKNAKLEKAQTDKAQKSLDAERALLAEARGHDIAAQKFKDAMPTMTDIVVSATPEQRRDLGRAPRTPTQTQPPPQTAPAPPQTAPQQTAAPPAAQTVAPPEQAVPVPEQAAPQADQGPQVSPVEPEQPVAPVPAGTVKPSGGEGPSGASAMRGGQTGARRDEAEEPSGFWKNVDAAMAIKPSSMSGGELAMLVAGGPVTGALGVHAKREFVSGFEQARREPIVERVNPQYPEPPCSPQDIVDVQNQILDTLDARAKTEATAAAAAKQQAKHKANEKPLGNMQKGTEDAITATDAHKQAVERRAGANAKQKDKETEVGGTLSDYSREASKLTTITLPMRGFQRFTGLATHLPDSPDILQGAKRGILKMSGDSKRFLTQLDKMDQAIADQKAAQPNREKQVASNSQTIKDTSSKAAQSDSSLNQAKQTNEQLTTDNKSRIDEAGSVRTSAMQTTATLDGQAQMKQMQARSLSASLQAWANSHRQARLDAMAQTQARLESQGYRVTEARER